MLTLPPKRDSCHSMGYPASRHFGVSANWMLWATHFDSGVASDRFVLRTESILSAVFRTVACTLAYASPAEKRASILGISLLITSFADGEF